MTDPIDIQDQDDTSTSQAAAEPRSESANPAPAAPDDVAPPVAALIASIRAAVAAGASVEARAAGATACRSILTVLEAKPGQPLAAEPQRPASPASPIAALLKQPGFLNQLAAMSREQLLDLLKQVTGAMPARPQTPTSGAPRFHLIQIPQVRRPDRT
jgi:hypothetical protein